MVIGTTGKGYLLMRHGGALWGVENAAVVSLTRGRGEGAGRFLVAVGGLGDEGEPAADLWIDEIVGVVAELAVRPLTAVLRRFWPDAADAAGGLAVHAQMPLVVVDPQRPPRVLRGAPPGDGRDGRDGRDGDGQGAHRDG